MINRVITGKGIGGLLKYVNHDKESLTSDRAQILDSNLASQDISGMTKEFAQLYKIRESIGKEKPKDAARHFVLSLPPNEKLSDEKWQEFGKKFLQEMGYINKDGEALTLYQMVRHNDTDKDHIHIVTSRIRFDGKLVDQHNEQINAEKITTKLEADFGLSSHKQRPKELGNHFTITLPSHADEAEFKREVKEISGFGKQTAKVKMLAEALGTADVAGSKWLTSNLQFVKKDEDKILLKFKNNMSVYLKATDTEGQYTCTIKANKEFSNFAEEFKTQLGQVVAVQAVATKHQPQLEAETQPSTSPEAVPAPTAAQNPWQALAEPPAPAEPFSLPVEDPAPAAALEEQWEALAALPASQQVAPDVGTPELAQTDLFEPFSKPAAAPTPEDAFQSLLEAAGGTGRGGNTTNQVQPGHGAGIEAEVAKATQQQKTQSLQVNQGGHHQGISMHMPVDHSKGSAVVVSGIVGGMDGSINALLKQIAHLQAIIMEGNFYEAVKQRALVQDQIRSLKAQVAMLEQAEANVKNKNVFNKHNFHKNADMAFGKTAKNNSSGSLGGKLQSQPDNPVSSNPFEERDDLSLEEMAIESLMMKIQGLEIAKMVAQSADELLSIESRLDMAVQDLKGVMQLMEQKAAASANTTRRKLAPKPTWVK